MEVRGLQKKWLPEGSHFLLFKVDQISELQ